MKNDDSILACISSAPSSVHVIHAAAGMAAAYGTGWTVLHIQTEGELHYPEQKKRSLKSNLDLADDLGAQINTIHGKNIADEIIRYATGRNIGKIVIGNNPRRKLSRFFRFHETILERLFAELPFYDIHVIPGKPEDYNLKTREQQKLHNGSGFTEKFNYKSIFSTVGILSISVVVGFLFYSIGLSDTNIVIIFLLAVLFVSITSGRFLGLASAVVSVITFNFLFTQPRFTFAVYDTQYLITFPVMLVVALTASEITGRMKKEAQAAEIRERRTEILYNISRSLLKTIGKKEIIITALEQVQGLMNKEFVCYLPADGKDTPEHFSLPLHIYDDKNEHVESSVKSIIEDEETNVVHYVMENGVTAGNGTEILPEAKGFYLPLRSREKVLGVFGVNCNGTGLDLSQRSILEAVTAQLALALDRERLNREREETRVEIERERLHSDLLRSISHDLRTPLTAIAGAGSTLLHEQNNINKKTRKKLLQNIIDDSTWLTQLVENLLSLTKAEGGYKGLSKEWEVVEEVILTVVNRMRKQAHYHTLRAILPSTPFLAPMDAGLIQQVLINIVDNAVRYTPQQSVIEVRAYEKESSAVFEVQDNGPGVPPRLMPQIFQRFVTAGNGIGKERRGLGLGLAICKSIIEAHGGTISVRNTRDKGALFQFSLPIPHDEHIVRTFNNEIEP